MDFLDNFAPVFAGSFLGGLTSIAIARWEYKKISRLSYIKYHLQFNIAKIYINRFIIEAETIINLVEGVERKNARAVLSTVDFKSLELNLEFAVKKTNPNLEGEVLKDFMNTLYKINIDAPLEEYRNLNGLFYYMASIYNGLLEECKYLVEHLPPKIDSGNELNKPLSRQLKILKRKYKKINKKIFV